MALQGKTAVITGGSGKIGSGIIRALLKDGASVIAPVRNARGAASLERDVADVPTERLQVLEADVGTEEGASKLAEAVKATFGQLDYAVTSIGAWWQKGPLLEQPLSEVEAQIHNLAVAHWLATRALVPLMRDSADSSYIIITGTAGERLYVPGSGLTSVGSATLHGISVVLRGELEAKAFRLNEVRLSAMVTRHEDAKASGPPYSHHAFGKLVVHTLQETTKKSEVIRVGNQELDHYA